MTVTEYKRAAGKAAVMYFEKVLITCTNVNNTRIKNVMISKGVYV